MPAKTSTMTGATKTQQSQPRIHPLFRKSQFLGNIDYDKVFRGPAILATRLLNTPQALHWAYAFFYGTEAKAETPLGFIPDGDAAAPKGTQLPRQYACNKAISKLSTEDIREVRKALRRLAHKCHFQVRDMESLGECVPSPVNDQYALITIQGNIYRRALLRHAHTKRENALIDLELATTLLHEIAHALNICYMGNRLETFFEDSIVAEHGWELECRLFGLVPHIASTGSPLEDPYWYAWQTRDLFKSDAYQQEYICRSEWKLPNECPQIPMKPKFAVQLCSDKFWEEDYVQKGAIALIPDVIQDFCRVGNRDNLTKGIPLSIRELFRENAVGKSYAEKKYPKSTKPRFGYRKAYIDPNDEGSEDGTEDDTGADPEADWSEGEGHDASSYRPEHMTDVHDDDDATFRDSDDEMTEVEEWVYRPKKLTAKKEVKVKAREF